MKQQWLTSRTLVPQSDGQRRWDLAYQLLWQWTLERESHLPPISAFKQEESNEDRPLRPCLNRNPTTETDD